VTNSTDGPKTAVLFNQRPMLNHLNVRVLDGDKVVANKQLGFMHSSHTDEIMAGRLVEERMGGTISVENVDGGSRFTLRLPRRG